MNSDKPPYWYYNPSSRASSSEIAFIGVGRAGDGTSSLLLAYTDLNNRLYNYLGYEPSETSYRELSTSAGIQEFGLKVLERYQLTADDGYVSYVLAIANKTRIQNARSEEARKESLIAKEAEDLILAGDELMKIGEDVSALKKYLASMVLTYSLTQIDSEYSFSVMLDEVLEIISTTEINLLNISPESGSCTVKVRRRDTVIPTRVPKAQIKASYFSVDSRGEEYPDSTRFSTDKRGDFEFIPKNHLMKRSGIILFHLDLDAEIEALSRISVQAAEIIKSVLISSGNSFNYALKYQDMIFGICALSLSDVGLYIPGIKIREHLDKLLDSDRVRNYIVDFTQEYSEDLEDVSSLDLEVVEKARIKDGYMIIVRDALVSTIESRNNIFVSTLQCYLSLFNVKTKEKIFDSGVFYINGYSDMKEASIDNAYSNLGDMVYSRIKNYYN